MKEKEERHSGSSNSNKDDKNELLTHFTQFTPFIPVWWQQYSSMAWNNMYNQCVKYTARMTEIYKESAKSTERITKYWLDYFWKPLSAAKEEGEQREREKRR